jgi:hypothetical protein
LTRHLILPRRLIPAGELTTGIVAIDTPATRMTVEISRFAWRSSGSLLVALLADTPDGGWRELAGCEVKASRTSGLSLLHVSLDASSFEAGTRFKVRLAAPTALETEIRLVEG